MYVFLAEKAGNSTGKRAASSVLNRLLLPMTLLLVVACGGQKYDMKDLFRAVESEDVDLVQKILDDGQDPNCRSEQWEGMTPLELSFSIGKSQEIPSVLLSNGADPDAFDSEGEYTLLMNCTLDENVTGVRLLLDSGADPNISESEENGGAIALHYAAMFGPKDIVELL